MTHNLFARCRPPHRLFSASASAGTQPPSIFRLLSIVIAITTARRGLTAQHDQAVSGPRHLFPLAWRSKRRARRSRASWTQQRIFRPRYSTFMTCCMDSKTERAVGGIGEASIPIRPQLYPHSMCSSMSTRRGMHIIVQCLKSWTH